MAGWVKEGRVPGKRPFPARHFPLEREWTRSFGADLFYLAQGGKILQKIPKKAARAKDNIDTSEVLVLGETPNPGNLKCF